MQHKFPKGFLWGAASAAHQVEGGLVNDWSRWELKSANDLARQGKERWNEEKRKLFPGITESKNYISGRACDHYHRYKEDFLLAKQLGHNATRISVDWSRIEPREGVFVQKELDHYLEVVKYLEEMGIEPMVTLWHWPLPLWLADKGGWKDKKTVEYFVRFSRKVVNALKSKVSFWLTLNEPEVYAANSYFIGEWPPQEKNIFSAWSVLNNLIAAHCQVYEAIKFLDKKARVGLAKQMAYFENADGKWLTQLVQDAKDYYWNQYVLKKTKDKLDFFGLNYYFHEKQFGWGVRNDDESRSDLDWELFPQGIYNVLLDLKKYDFPVYITENGLADAFDKDRTWFIEKSLQAVARAMQQGVDVRGYLHWSLTDNFEWNRGFWPRFGLIEIDYKTLERKIRPSAWEYKIIINNGIGV
ncbi:MAG: glycoside hydrolase family 1 protein [Patescibacteria group bacterium]